MKLQVLGWGTPWTGFSMRYPLLRQFLESVPDEDVVCHVDAYDVLPRPDDGRIMILVDVEEMIVKTMDFLLLLV